jgi:hypothetical protein
MPGHEENMTEKNERAVAITAARMRMRNVTDLALQRGLAAGTSPV